MKVRLFTSCNEISIYNFNKILDTDNLAYMVFGWDEYEEIEFDKEDSLKLWKEIYNEYTLLTDDNKTIMYYQLILFISRLETKRYVVSKLIEMMLPNDMEEETLKLYIATLREWNYKINPKEPLQEELLKILRDLRAMENRIRLKKNELDSYKEEGSKMTLVQQVVKLERALEKNNIDPRKTSVEKWVMMLREVSEINKARKNKVA